MNIRSAEKATEIVKTAGGQIVGHTRLQKIAYFLDIAGLDTGFSFQYKHYGPYSEDLAGGARIAHLLKMLNENEAPASWGGTYSTYIAQGDAPAIAEGIRTLAQQAATANSIELELAATALFLARENNPNPWEETARRKPEKAAGGRLNRAKALYQRLQSINTPEPLPSF